MVPVGMAQVGCTVALAVGMAGTTGTVFTVNEPVAPDMQVIEAARRVIKVWPPGAKPAKVTLAWYVPPSILYS